MTIYNYRMVIYRIKGQHLAHEVHDEVVTVGWQLIEGGHLWRQVTFASDVSLGRLTGTSDVLVWWRTQEINDQVQLYSKTQHPRPSLRAYILPNRIKVSK